MNSFFRLTALIAVAGLAGITSASAALSSDYKPPKLAQLGKTSVPIGGSGTVVVKVLVKADGSFAVQNVIRSTNHADDDAALDIAKNSTYHVGLHGGKPTTAFYDFTLKFKGKSFAAADQSTGSSGGSVAAINRMLRASNFVGAAAEFDKLGSIPSRYASVAGSTYATAAVQMQQSNAQQALAYGQKAVSLTPVSNSYFALGVAQLANNDNAGAVTSLKRAHDMGGGPRTSKDRVILDKYLLQAYNATGNSAGATAITAEIAQLAPSGAGGGVSPAQSFYNQAVAAENAGRFEDAVKLFEQGAQADPASAVTGYAQAAFAIGKMDKPDLNRMKMEADKAVAAKPDDPAGNYAEGVALTQLGLQNNNAAQKKQGLDFLNKADAEAKAANIPVLVKGIENFIKSIPQ